MLTRRLFVTVCAVVLLGAGAWAHPGHSHKVLGTIAKIDGKNVTVKGTDGKDVTFEVTARTKLVREPKVKGMFEEIKAGMRAVVTLDDKDGKTASELRYSEVATSKQ